MNNLINDLNNLKTYHKTVFKEICEDIASHISVKNKTEALEYLKIRAKKVKSEIHKVHELRQNCKCIGCGSCCKFAVSEFSPEELNQKALNGDNYAKQFTSVFIPYENLYEASKIFPEYVELLKTVEDYYIYHCPKVTKDNRCPDYENRPQICRDFPDNPITFLPPVCGFNSWKKQTEKLALKLNSEMKIIDFYINNVK